MSSYDRPTPARSIQVITGGMLASACLWMGVLTIAPEYHVAMTMKPEPDKMGWHTLAHRGLVDNAYVQLVNVELESMYDEDDILDPLGALDALEEVGASLDLSEEERKQLKMMRSIANFQGAATMLSPLIVTPAGSDADTTPPTIIVPAAHSETARRQLEQNSFLLGHVQLQSEYDRLDYFGDEDTPEDAYVLVPMDEPPNRESAASWFWLCGLGVSVGMVLCCSGGPSLVCCVIFSGHSLLSLFGYPLRYGRGNNITRGLYVFIGLGLMSFGYQTLVGDAKMGSIDGNVALVALGFPPTFIGLAAVLGAVTNYGWQWFDITSDPTPPPKKPKISIQQACSIEPIHVEKACVYQDPVLTSFTQSIHGIALNAVERRIAPMEFSNPKRFDLIEPSGQTGLSLSLGCRDMVAAEIRTLEGETQSRLISVLDDGLVVATLSANHLQMREKRLGTGCFWNIHPSDDLAAMLSDHLDQVASMAEQRRTAITVLEQDDLNHLFRYARRAIAAVQSQYGDELLEVEPATHGRFRFPPLADAPKPLVAPEETVSEETGEPIVMA